MDRLYEDILKELKYIEEKGLNTHNLEIAYKLASLGKNLKKLERYENTEEMKGDKKDIFTPATNKLCDILYYLRVATENFLHGKKSY